MTTQGPAGGGAGGEFARPRPDRPRIAPPRDTVARQLPRDARAAEPKVAAGQRTAEEIGLLIRARYPILFLCTAEEERVEEVLTAIAAGSHQVHPKILFLWTATQGLTRDGREVDPATRDPQAALEYVAKFGEASLFLFKDLHPFMNDSVRIRKLRDVSYVTRTTQKSVVLVGRSWEIPADLQELVTVVDFPLPDRVEIGERLDAFIRQYGSDPRVRIGINAQEREEMCRALTGLTMSEVENCLAKALVGDRRLDREDIARVIEEKRQIIRKGGLLEFTPTAGGLESVGGLENLKSWLTKRTRLFTDDARRFGIPPPKGVLLTGVSGCGKSLCARCVSFQWRLPLLRFDVGRVFGQYVGSSEKNMRDALKTAETVAPCILFVDEVEKAFAQTGGEADGGTSARVFGTFLTWMQERIAPVFVIATANRIANLPAEFLRKGRFDEIFFVDLPHAAEREAIFTIHIRKSGRDPAAFDLAGLAKASDGFSGAEIEQVVNNGMVEAFHELTELRNEHMHVAMKRTVPLSTTMREQIEQLRAWADVRAVRASRLAADRKAGPAEGEGKASAEHQGGREIEY